MYYKYYIGKLLYSRHFKFTPDFTTLKLSVPLISLGKNKLAPTELTVLYKNAAPRHSPLLLPHNGAK